MKVLARVGPDSWKRTPIVHLVTETDGVKHALCSSRMKYPAEGEKLKSGAVWTVREMQGGDRLCKICRARKSKLDNPASVPARKRTRNERALAEQKRLAEWNNGEARR